METRDVIGQAKGMLMERFDVELSQDTNARVEQISLKLIEPDHPPS